eukprot:Gregarina_sp_Poly_1__4016@NODE_2213_length_2478_cov_88_958109_g1427_i0_p2_GENE_NODE_2213_length_2478_cov_88_958109_g1427_i0NODE_2213_length_2478_cov_88_958109_g1427_i0_p2_ORF_typecomplete_len137_score7_05Pro_isomerase/PF00160_21/7_2e18_NODE_2213_length_2478_cov_88_958109_g1427_i017952205
MMTTALFFHDQAGLLCTASLGRPNTNTSQFYITIAPCPWQDGRDVVFGRIVGGMKVLVRLEQLGSARGIVNGDVRIANCGVLPSPNVRSLHSPVLPVPTEEAEVARDNPPSDYGTNSANQQGDAFQSTGFLSTDPD